MHDTNTATNGAYAYEDWVLHAYYSKQMDVQHSRNAISWRKLFLSRAKLKATGNTSALLSGFAMVALVEIGIEPDVPSWLMVVFCVNTTLLVSIHLLAVMISTCILPHIEAVSNVHNVNSVHESPHERMQVFIQMAWTFSTGFGILLFLNEIVLICWIKFNVKTVNNNITAAWAATAVVIPVGILFLVFAFHFYRRLIAHKFQQTNMGLQDLDKMVTELGNQENDFNDIENV
ncbi:protein orai-3-like [Mizuhopecten yessoensis]|uniref:Protein orai-2 n=1 Tax=Mizuhopecten yessoensis TaxID=6573 RepID=A0A210PWZ6_MIZYE|nr:protein orai-3-like [Mizuhopecten yessoensis]OWF40994.1 Protein orai-2 [Mizuhopecten yessoensis]